MGTADSVKLLGTGAIASSIAASVCCLGPLGLAALGLGGGALLLKLAPYRPYLLAMTGLLLGAAFFLSYRPSPSGECVPGSACGRPTTRKRQRVVLWIVTVIVAIAATFPYLSGALF